MCAYCINGKLIKEEKKSVYMTGAEWVRGINRLKLGADLPVTLQGGEPSLHPQFAWIINHIRKDINIDILTNLSFNPDIFIKEVKPERINRDAPYAPIRVTYHPEKEDINILLEKTIKLTEAGFRIGVYGILHPKYGAKVMRAKEMFLKKGLDFRTKEFLGDYENKTYGKYLYPDAVKAGEKKKCLCRASELIIGPDCGIYRCHHYLYSKMPDIGNLLDNGLHIEDKFRDCDEYGYCNYCDVKIKTDRYQKYGYTSVKIKGLKK